MQFLFPSMMKVQAILQLQFSKISVASHECHYIFYDAGGSLIA